MTQDARFSRIEKIVVLGGGSAGLLAALALKSCRANFSVRVFRSSAIGVIGVGEGTTPPVCDLLHKACRIPVERFIREASPTIKLGLRFEWGKRAHFNLSYGFQTAYHFPQLPKSNGFYCDDDFTAANHVSSLMDRGKAFASMNGNPVWNELTSYHVYNPTFVQFLEKECAARGVELIDAKVERVEADERGVSRLHFDHGRTAEGDLYVDASGFKSLLLGETMKVPFVDFSNTLYCDRALVGAWDRTSEPILPYTNCETMDAGWCWQIEHEECINRGYVYSSKFISDDLAEAELRRKNPKLTKLNPIKFRSGYYEQSWVGNVVGIGNACGFVEPLESTGLMIICEEARRLANALACSNQTVTPTLRALHNRVMANEWESIRGFLSLHYKFNDRLDTAFWKAARADVELGNAAAFVEFYKENGPLLVEDIALLGRNDLFGLEGHNTMMIGQRVPYANQQTVSSAEWATWRNIQSKHWDIAHRGLDIRQMLEGIRSGRMQFVQMQNDGTLLR